MIRLKLSVCLVFLTFSPELQAAQTGRDAAVKYFQNRKPTSKTRSVASYQKDGNQRLALAVGRLFNGESYNWGQDGELSGWSLQASYFNDSGLWLSRGYHLEVQNFNSGDENLSKLSFLMSFDFPRRQSFPVFVGTALGPSYFTKQFEGESEFAFDYKFYGGFRIGADGSQYFLQSGIKNHVQMISDGQFMGWFIASGVAYKF